MLSRMLRAALAAGALTLALAAPSLAQLDANLGGLTPENVKGYLAPLPKALSTTLNMGAFQSADIPLAGINFNIGVYAMGATFEDEDKTFRPKDSVGFTGDGTTSTVIGGTSATTLTRADHSAQIFPGGFDLDQIVVPMPQLSIGSVAGTRAVVRWIQFDAGDSELGDISLFGIGLQHSINRYLPQKLPVDLAVGGMYQTFTLGDDKLIDTKAFHGEITASKKLAMWVQPYVGIGYDTFSMEVNYDQDVGGTTQSASVDFDSENAFHATAGVLLGLPFVKLNAQVDHGTETGAAVGIRFGVGN